MRGTKVVGYEVVITNEGYFDLDLPHGAEPLSVAMGWDNTPYLYIMIDARSTAKEKCRFFVFRTGRDYPDLLTGKYVGTFQLRGYNYHVFSED